jgi:hypothetical protein
VRCFTILGEWFPAFRTAVPWCSRSSSRRRIRLLHTEDEGTIILRNVWNYLSTDTERKLRRLNSSETLNRQIFLRKKKVISKGNIVPIRHSHKLRRTLG